MSTWPSVSLAEISSKPQYGAIAKGRELPAGPLFVRQTDITGGRIDWATVPFCDLDAESAKRYTLKRGDLLISRLGNGVGNAATVSHDREDAVFAGYLVRFQPNEENADPRFVGYQLQSKRWRDHVTSFRSGAAQPTLNAQQMGDFTFLLPPIAEQRAIAATLGALDNKIESNRRICLCALGLADQLFLFALEAGQRQVEVDEVADFHNRRRIPLSNNERLQRAGNIPYYGATGVFGHVNEALFDEILVLVGEDGSVVRKDGGPVLQYIWGPAWINNHAHPLTARGVSNETLFLALNRTDIRPIVTGAAQPKVNMRNLKSLLLNLPTDVRELEQKLNPLFELYRSKQDEIVRLKTLRDALLPELLSGRIRAADVEVA